MTCPFCNSPDLMRENGKTWCQACQREIVEIAGESAKSEVPLIRGNIQCTFCNSQNLAREGDKIFCQDCGFEVNVADVPTKAVLPSALPAGIMKCPLCGHRVSAAADNCPACGQPLRAVLASHTEFADIIVKFIKWATVMFVIGFIVYNFLIRPLLDNAIDSYIHG